MSRDFANDKSMQITIRFFYTNVGSQTTWELIIWKNVVGYSSNIALNLIEYLENGLNRRAPKCLYGRPRLGYDVCLPIRRSQKCLKRCQVYYKVETFKINCMSLWLAMGVVRFGFLALKTNQTKPLIYIKNQTKRFKFYEAI